MPIGLKPEDFFPLRAQNIYNPNNFGADLPTYDMNARLAQLYQPRSDITDQFVQALQQMPQREHPGKLRTIAAIMAGLGAGAGPAAYEGGAAVGFRGNPKEALGITDAVLNKPYYDKLQDWQTKTGALKEGAEQEQRYNTNQRVLANDIIGREIQDRGLAEKTRHELETERTANQKSEQIYQTKLADLERKSQEATNKLNFAMDEASRKQGNTEAELKLRQAQLDALNARHQLDIAQKDRALAEQQRLHDTMKEKWEGEKADREKRIAQYEKQLGINQQKANQSPGSTDKTTSVTIKDAKGNVTQTRETHVTGGAKQQPNDALRTKAIDTLKAQGKPVTEANIKFVMDKLGKQ